MEIQCCIDRFFSIVTKKNKTQNCYFSIQKFESKMTYDAYNMDKNENFRRFILVGLKEITTIELFSPNYSK